MWDRENSTTVNDKNLEEIRKRLADFSLYLEGVEVIHG